MVYVVHHSTTLAVCSLSLSSWCLAMGDLLRDGSLLGKKSSKFLFFRKNAKIALSQWSVLQVKVKIRLSLYTGTTCAHVSVTIWRSLIGLWRWRTACFLWRTSWNPRSFKTKPNLAESMMDHMKGTTSRAVNTMAVPIPVLVVEAIVTYKKEKKQNKWVRMNWTNCRKR